MLDTTSPVERAVVDRSRLRAVVLIAVLNVLDIVTTTAALRMGADEGNPVAAFLIDRHLLVPAKVVLCGTVVAGIRYRRRRPVRLPSFEWLVVGVYTLVVTLNTITITQLAGGTP